MAVQSSSERDATVWVDVEDFFDYFVGNPFPSGIQRLAFEIKQALLQITAPGRVRFVRRGTDGTLREIPWSQIGSLMEREPRPLAGLPPRGKSLRAGVLRFINSLPEHLRTPLLRAGLFHLHAGRQWREIARRRRPAVPVLLSASVAAG